MNRKQAIMLDFNNRYKPQTMTADGSVRAGKTWLLLQIFFLLHVAAFRAKAFIVTGHSIGSIERNVVKPLQDDLGIKAVLNQYNEFDFLGNKICCFGTAKADSFKAMRGMTSYGHYGNEHTLCHISAHKEVLARCSGEGARHFLDMNPDTPMHYIYREYIEPAERNGNNQTLARFHFHITDNARENGGILAPEYIDKLKRSYFGIWRKKYFDGLWVAAEGQIYFETELQYYSETELLEAGWFDNVVILGQVDPATGSNAKTGCFTSMITAAIKNNCIYILDVVLRKLGVEEVKDEIGAKLQQYNYAEFGIEGDFSQDRYVVKPIKKAFPFAPILTTYARGAGEKISRIIGMSGVVYRHVYFPDRYRTEINSDGWLLLQQLCNINKNEVITNPDEAYKFVDGPDNLEALVRRSSRYLVTGVKLDEPEPPQEQSSGQSLDIAPESIEDYETQMW